jgi:hypothetical protein
MSTKVRKAVLGEAKKYRAVRDVDDGRDRRMSSLKVRCEEEAVGYNTKMPPVKLASMIHP